MSDLTPLPPAIVSCINEIGIDAYIRIQLRAIEIMHESRDLRYAEIQRLRTALQAIADETSYDSFSNGTHWADPGVGPMHIAKKALEERV